MSRWRAVAIGVVFLAAVGVGAVLALGAPGSGRLADPPGGGPTVHEWTVEDGRAALEVVPEDPVAGEKITFSGRLTPAMVREVILEAEMPEWTPVASGSTDASGRLSLTTTAPDDARRYRVRAPRTEQVQADGAAVYTRQVTSRKTVTPLPQRATLTFAPAPVGQSEDGDDDLTPGVARFRPARPGRPVVLERRTAGSWKEVMTSEQNDRGVARFNVPISPGDGRGDYRAVAVEHAGAHVVETNPETVAGVAPIWAEEFNGTSLDTGTWGHRHLGVRSEASQRSCAETSESVVSVKGGLARLRVEEITPPQDPDNCPHGEFRNAHIGTQDTFSFTYGVMAARIKFPHQEGQHGALWSQPIAPEVVPGEPGRNGAEIDAVEYFGDGFQDGALQHSIYYKAPDGQAAKVGGARDLNHLLPPGEKWSDGFHVYSVEWTPDEYIFRVNGHETLRTDEGVSTTAQYVILSLLTSDWELENMDADNLNAMQVDWVRVWQP